tara:strand:- start:801 stop:1694 length:894 start_codon:yes stop_codon:yes gene_type:complete
MYFSKIKSIIKVIYHLLFLLNFKKYSSDIVLNYLSHLKNLSLKENFLNEIKIRFYNKIFFIPKTVLNAQIIVREEKEKNNILSIHKALSQPTTYIDIGANIGYWTFSRNIALGSKIKFYCFEPSKINFYFLEKNLKKFQNIKIFNYGLSDCVEKKILSFPAWENLSKDKNTGLLSLHGNTDINSETVNLITLDNFIKKNKIENKIFIKIDTEGYEFNVLNGAKNFLSNNSDIVIQLEVNFKIEDNIKNNNIKKSINLLKQLKYSPFLYENFYIKNISNENLEEIIKKKLSLELYFKK